MSTQPNVKEKSKSKVITGMVRFSYLHAFVPKAITPGQEEKYSVSLLIKKGSEDTLKRIKAAIDFTIKEAMTGTFKGFSKEKIAKLKLPLRDGDIDKPEDSVYAGMMFVNANTKQKPGMMDADGNEIVSSDQLKSGDYGRASITFFAFDKAGNVGIGVSLNHLQKLKDGEALGGRAAIDEDFAEPYAADDEDEL